MNKKLLGIIIALVVAAALGGALFFLNQTAPEEEASSSSTATASIVLLEKTVEDVAKIQLENDDSFEIVPSDGEFIIEELTDLPLLTTQLERVAENLALIQALELIDEAPENLADYGLSDPRGVATVTFTDNTTAQLSVGSEAAGNAGTYVLYDGKVYLFADSRTSNLLSTQKDFIDLTITDSGIDPSTQYTIHPSEIILGGTVRPEEIVIEEIDTSSMEAGDEKFGLGTHMITAPKVRAFNFNLSDTFFNSLYSIRAEEVAVIHPTPEEMTTFGFDEPYCTLEFTYAATDEDPVTVQLKVTEPDSEGLVYMMKDSLPVIYQVSSSGLTWLDIQYGDVVSSLAILPSIDTVKTLTVTTPDQTYVFELAGEGEELTVTGNGQNLDTDNFRDFYQVVLSTVYDEYTEEEPTGDPILTYRYDYRDTTKSSDVVEFRSGPTRRVFITVNGETEFYGQSSYVEKVYRDLEKVMNNEDIVT